MKKNNYICPICGYDGLQFIPANSYEICPCCGYEFGTFEYNGESLDKYFPDCVEDDEVYDFIRDTWLGQGAKWWSESRKQPTDWSLINQLNNIKGYMFEKNKKAGGFGEFQYCDKDLPIKDLLDYNNIENWKDDSLYIEYATYTSDLFWEYYLPILKNAYIDENKIGFDDFGVNYYTPEQTLFIYNQIKENENLPDREILLAWLKVVIDKYNGFYFLGA